MGGADKINLDLLRLLVTRHGYEVTIVATVPGYQTWLPELARLTPDIFVLDRFLRPVDYPRFLRYLIVSRQIDTVLISGSELTYLLVPYLRATCPGITVLDYLHIEAESWKNGGYHLILLNQAAQIDLTITSSEYLKHWLVERGGNPARIEVCTTNIDTDDWDPTHYNRQALRDELGIDSHMPVILYAARICAQKQPLVFAEAIRQLKQRGHSFVALVAGDGEDRVTLAAFVKRHALNEVRMLGSVGLERMHELMT